MKKTVESIVRRAVREEVRGELLMHGPQIGELPLPSDLDREKQVVSWVLQGQIRLEELALSPKEFFLPLYRELLLAVETLYSVQMPNGPKRIRFSVTAICKAMTSGGVVNAERFAEEIVHLSTRDPSRDLTMSVYPAASTVKAMSKRRELCKLFRELDLQLRAGATTPLAARLAVDSAVPLVGPLQHSTRKESGAPQKP